MTLDMTRLDLATSAAKGALSLVLLAGPGYAQTYKEATMPQVAPAPPAASKDTAIRPFKFHASDERSRTCAGESPRQSGQSENR